MHCNDQVTGGTEQQSFVFYELRSEFSFDDCNSLDATDFIPDGCHYSYTGEPMTGYLYRGTHWMGVAFEKQWSANEN